MVTIDKNISLTGQKVNLRRVRKPDAESIQKYGQDIEIARYTYIPHPFELDDAFRLIKNTHRMFRNNSGLWLGIEAASAKEIIGLIGTGELSWRHNRAEIGCWVGKPYWRQGLASEAVQIFLKYLFRSLKLNRVQARVMTPNIKSAKMLEKLGFTYEGKMREACLQYGERYDFLFYGILKNEFKMRQ
jgi:ribosomal-protein-alanine N-acetyltransferase